MFGGDLILKKKCCSRVFCEGPQHVSSKSCLELSRNVTVQIHSFCASFSYKEQPPALPYPRVFALSLPSVEDLLFLDIQGSISSFLTGVTFSAGHSLAALFRTASHPPPCPLFIPLPTVWAGLVFTTVLITSQQTI